MNRRFLPIALVCLPVMLSGCGSTNLWPFGGDAAQQRSIRLANATEYQCPGGKRFHLRYLDDGAAWLILPDREFRLDKAVSGGGSRFSNGSTVLEITGSEAAITEGSALSYSGCKVVAK